MVGSGQYGSEAEAVAPMASELEKHRAWRIKEAIGIEKEWNWEEIRKKKWGNGMKIGKVKKKRE